MAVVVDDTTPPVVLGDDNRHGESTLFLTLLLIKNKRVNFQDPVMTTIEIKDCGNVLIVKWDLEDEEKRKLRGFECKLIYSHPSIFREINHTSLLATASKTGQ